MLRSLHSTRFALLGCTALLLLGMGGCGSSGGGALPSNEVARSALESALNAWRDGKKPGDLARTEPSVAVLDTAWSQGARLESYEILREEPSVAERKFTVRLSLAKPSRDEEVMYYVIGRGPVQVFREEDYLRNMNMEDAPKPSRSSSTTTRRK